MEDSRMWKYLSIALIGTIRNPAGSGQGADEYSSDLKSTHSTHTDPKKHESSKERRIMIIDDEPDVLITFKVYLSEYGLHTFATTDPAAALEEFTKDIHRYYLVILDVRMKSINGLQLYTRLKGLRPDIKIILVSALDIPAEIFTILPGFRKTDFMSKPVQMNTLVTRVLSALDEK